MPIIIHSPHSGQPVKVRDEDIGRAVRDQDGRVFYVVPRSTGEGYYAALTRKGSAKDEERYDKLETRIEQVQEQVDTQAKTVHDATGRRRANPVGRLVLLFIVLAALGAGGYTAYLAWGGGTAPDWWPLPAPSFTPVEPLKPGEPVIVPKPQLFTPTAR